MTAAMTKYKLTKCDLFTPSPLFPDLPRLSVGSYMCMNNLAIMFLEADIIARSQYIDRLLASSYKTAQAQLSSLCTAPPPSFSNPSLRLLPDAASPYWEIYIAQLNNMEGTIKQRAKLSGLVKRLKNLKRAGAEGRVSEAEFQEIKSFLPVDEYEPTPLDWQRYRTKRLNRLETARKTVNYDVDARDIHWHGGCCLFRDRDGVRHCARDTVLAEELADEWTRLGMNRSVQDVGVRRVSHREHCLHLFCFIFFLKKPLENHAMVVDLTGDD